MKRKDFNKIDLLICLMNQLPESSQSKKLILCEIDRLIGEKLAKHKSN